MTLDKLRIRENGNDKHATFSQSNSHRASASYYSLGSECPRTATSFQYHPHSKLTDLNSEHMNVSRARPISCKGKRLTCIPYYQENGWGMCVIAILNAKCTQWIWWIIAPGLSESFDLDNENEFDIIAEYNRTKQHYFDKMLSWTVKIINDNA